jgi:DNA polymerase
MALQPASRPIIDAGDKPHLLQHKLKSLSLKSVAKHFGLPEKGTFLAQARGMTRLDLLANDMWQQYTEYCLHDVELCRMIFLLLAPKLPTEEFIVHDMVTRCAVEPMFRLDANILAEHLNAVRLLKEEMLDKAMQAGAVSKDVLMSNPQFAELLRSLGVEPPMKVSLATGELTYAFSRQDIDFMELLNHEDPRVQAVMAARLGFKSTLEETRTERMLNIASLDFPHHGSGVMPIPLKIGAAITHRLGGDWQLNCQNWGRTSPIRKSVSAPDGWVVVASDAAQIET